MNNHLGCEQNMWDYILKWGKYFLSILIIITFLEQFIFAFSIVQGDSMKPTLKNNDRLFVNRIVYRFQEPHYGDIVIFNPPINGRMDELFIKRIIATEGDQFQIKDGDIYINNIKVEENYINKEGDQDKGYLITSGKVPKDMIFVMGDNRNNSNDSRCFGFVPKRSIKGKVNLRVWPFDAWKVF